MDNSNENLDLNSSYSTKYSIQKLNEPNDSVYNASDKTKYFSSSNFLPIITNIRPVNESNSVNYISNRSFDNSHASTNSLVSSPSSISVNNSIECKNDNSSRWLSSLSKGPSYLKSHLNLHSNKKYSFEKADWKSRNLTDTSSTESFRYTIPTIVSSSKCLDDLENNQNYLNQRRDSTFIKSLSFNNFNHFRKYSVDSVALTASTRYLSQRKQLNYANNSSLRFKGSVDLTASSKRFSVHQFDYLKNQKQKLEQLNKCNFDRTLERKNSSKSDTSLTGDKSFSKLQKLTLLCILTVSFCSYCSCSILAPFFPSKASEKGLSETQAGFVFSIFALISVIFSPFLGKLIPIFGAKTLILFGIILGGISNLLFGAIENVQNSTSFFVLCVLTRTMESFGTCCHATASYTYIIKFFPHSIGFVFGLTETFVGVALCLGPGIGSFLYHFGGYRLPFYVFGTVVLLCLPFNWYFLENIDEADELSDKDGKESSSNGSENEAIEVTYWGLMKIPKILVICMVIVVMSLAQSVLEPTLEPHLRKTFGLKQEYVGLEFLLSSTSYAISTPLVGYVATKTKNKFIIMLVGTLITLVGLLIIGPSKLIYFASPSLLISTIGLVLISFGHGIAFIPTFEALFDYCLKSGFRDNIRTYAKVSGLWGCLFSLGEFIGPFLGGWVVEISDFQTASTIIAIIAISTVPFILLMVFKANQEISTEEDDDLASKFDDKLNPDLKKDLKKDLKNDLKNDLGFFRVRSNSVFVLPSSKELNA